MRILPIVLVVPYAEFLKPKNVVLGGDVRLTSESLKLALSNGIRDAGSDVIDIGMVGTEQVYFATSHLQAGGGIEVTASHNPIDYNGMKPIRENSKPISSDTGLLEIKKLAEKMLFLKLKRASEVPTIRYRFSMIILSTFVPM
jgi:phosphomannomutase